MPLPKYGVRRVEGAALGAAQVPRTTWRAQGEKKRHASEHARLRSKSAKLISPVPPEWLGEAPACVGQR